MYRAWGRVEELNLDKSETEWVSDTNWAEILEGNYNWEDVRFLYAPCLSISVPHYDQDRTTTNMHKDERLELRAVSKETEDTDLIAESCNLVWVIYRMSVWI